MKTLRKSLQLHVNNKVRRQAVSVPKRHWSALPSAAGFNSYEETKRNFKIQVPEYFNFASDVIDQWAAKEVGAFCSSDYQ